MHPPCHADPAFVILDKPAGLLAVPGIGERGRLNLWAQAREQWPDLLVVHRLDLPTSGLIVFARGAPAQRQLSMAFERRAVEKTYVAVVEGLVDADAGTIDLPLGPDWPHRPRQQVDRLHGKPSCTHYRVLGRDAAQRRTRLELRPVTGRSHQLRVHLAAIGYPIAGDVLYGADPAGAPRVLLHAQALAFTHPFSGAPVRCESRAPF